MKCLINYNNNIFPNTQLSQVNMCTIQIEMCIY